MRMRSHLEFAWADPVFAFLQYNLIDWIPQEIGSIQDHSCGSHALHKQHKDTVWQILPKIQGLSDSDPQVKAEGTDVEDEYSCTHPIDLQIRAEDV